MLFFIFCLFSRSRNCWSPIFFIPAPICSNICKRGLYSFEMVLRMGDENAFEMFFTIITVLFVLILSEFSLVLGSSTDDESPLDSDAEESKLSEFSLGGSGTLKGEYGYFPMGTFPTVFSLNNFYADLFYDDFGVASVLLFSN